MHIQQHNLQLGSEHSYQRQESERESVRVGRVSIDPASGNRRVDVVYEASREQHTEVNTYSAQDLRARQSASPSAESLMADLPDEVLPETFSATNTLGNNFSSPVSGQAEPGSITALKPEDQLKLQLLMRLHKAITGKEIKLTLMDTSALHQPTVDTPVSPGSTPTPTGQQQPAAQQAFGVEYDYSLRIEERESSRFTASGHVITADGQTIEIDLELHMARSVTLEQRDSLRLGARLSDPLVLNFDGNAAELSNTRFRFDLDLDGRQDEVPMLSGDRAFLALDRNGDGKINDGKELFGAKSGDGFAELAQYDEDGNGFIDSGDSIFSRLRLWTPTTDGQGQLLSLGSRNVGAIWLGSAETEFSLTPDLTENRLGVIRSSSFYLSEDGQVGSVQQLDLSI